MNNSLVQHQLVISPVQVSMPKQDVLIRPKMGQQMLSGHLTAVDAQYMLDNALPDGVYRDVREDLARFAPVPVTRAAFKFSSNSYVGVIDSNGTPYFFALNSRGLLLRPAADAAKAWVVFDRYAELERDAALAQRRARADREQVALVLDMSKAVKHPGSRGGKFYYDDHGHVRYGERSVPKTQHAQMEDHKVGVAVSKKHALNKDDKNAIHLHNALHAAQPKTVKEAHRVVAQAYKQLYDFDSKEAHHAATRQALKYLHENGSFSLHEVAPAQKVFTTRKALAKPLLPTAPVGKGTPLVVNGKPVKLSPEAEQACLAWAKRFIIGGDPRAASWRKNFERSLQLLGVPPGKYDFKHFVARAMTEEKAPRSTSTEEITPKTRPDLFVEQDGKVVRLDQPKFPTGSFYASKSGGGAWVRPIREEEMIFNGSIAPKGWKGKVVYEPGARWVYSWTHPVAALYPGVKPSKFSGYVSTLSDNVRAEIEKFQEASRFGKNLERIRSFMRKGLVSPDPATRAMAACNYLMDIEHIRVGEETYADEKYGDKATFGIASMRAKHIKIDGNYIIFNFPGKKGEEWYRVVDCSERPTLLSVFKQALKGKKPNDRVWEGTHNGKKWKVTSKEVNDYLKAVDPGFHAHQYRTYYANTYMRTHLEKLQEAIDMFAKKGSPLTPAEIKALYKGVDMKKPKAKAFRALLNRQIGGKTLQEYVGIATPEVVDGKQITGVLPTVAERLGHTTGACRNSYIDPLLVVPFGIKHGWDERTAKEKRGRSDVPAFVKPIKEKK